jgi:hypothetical protein
MDSSDVAHSCFREGFTDLGNLNEVRRSGSCRILQSRTLCRAPSRSANTRHKNNQKEDHNVRLEFILPSFLFLISHERRPPQHEGDNNHRIEDTSNMSSMLPTLVLTDDDRTVNIASTVSLSPNAQMLRIDTCNSPKETGTPQGILRVCRIGLRRSAKTSTGVRDVFLRNGIVALLVSLFLVRNQHRRYPTTFETRRTRRRVSSL